MQRLRSYGQYCGLAQALDLIGERWALLIVRDLLLGPKRFTDLRLGLPRIPTNVLSARLKELETAGVIRRRTLPRPSSVVAYELTEYGAELESIVLRLGLWGAKSMGAPKPEDIVTADGEALALKANFKPELAAGVQVSYEVHVGDVVVHALIDDGTITVGEGAAPDADLVVAMPEMTTLKPLLTRELPAGEAVGSGAVRLTGDMAEFERFLDLFGTGAVSAAV
ncbi:MAG: helix-turn-helix transcriptional regulator [Actinomycetota bacterium]|nr:helix-turn-helix transcriptional regulator [Actinomycetota bacterium]